MSTIAVLLPNGEQQFLDSNGDPLAGGFVYMYVPGSTTPKLTYVDQGLTTPNTNPIQLDSSGRAIIWGSGSYRQVVTDVNGGLIWDQLTSDGGVNSINTTIANLPAEIAALQLLGFQADVVYQTSSYTLKASKVVIIGLAGGGGGAGTNSGAATAPGAGGAGATFIQTLSGLAVGGTLAITVGTGGSGGGTTGGGGNDGTATTVASGTQLIPTLTANPGLGAPNLTTSGHGGNLAGSYTLNLHGEDGNRADSDVSIGGRSAMFFPFGSGGCLLLNGQIILDNAVASQDGTQGLVMILGVW